MTIAKGRRACGFRNFTSFTDWLSGQAARDDAVGEFARMVAADPGWPRRRTTLPAFVTYLFERDGPFFPRTALDSAWMEYEKALGTSTFRGN